MKFISKSVLYTALLLAASLASSSSQGQKLDTVSSFSISTYIDAYYAYYSDSTGPGAFQKFPSVSPRSNSPSLNTAHISLIYNAEKVRAMGVLHFGDIAAATWAPAPYNHVMEAHVGFKLLSKLWVDAGFFRTHFGTEYLLPSENITSSVSVGTFYEPYYESGFRLNFDPTKKLEINLYLLNGYGIYTDNNNKKSFGLAATYAITDNTGIGITNYTGDDTPPEASKNHLRIHNNIYVNTQRGKFKLQVGGDYCFQQNSDIATGSKMATMFSGLATVKYQCATRCAVYARGEIFQDKDGIMSGVIKDYYGKATGYKLWGATAGLEYKPTPESYIKLEGRYLKMDKDQYIFTYNNDQFDSRFEVMIHGGITFDLLRSIKTHLSGGGGEPQNGTLNDE